MTRDLFLFFEEFYLCGVHEGPATCFVSVFLRVYPVCGIFDLFLFFCAYTPSVGGVLAGSLCHFVSVCPFAYLDTR